MSAQKFQVLRDSNNLAFQVKQLEEDPEGKTYEPRWKLEVCNDLQSIARRMFETILSCEQIPDGSWIIKLESMFPERIISLKKFIEQCCYNCMTIQLERTEQSPIFFRYITHEKPSIFLELQNSLSTAVRLDFNETGYVLTGPRHLVEKEADKFQEKISRKRNAISKARCVGITRNLIEKSSFLTNPAKALDAPESRIFQFCKVYSVETKSEMDEVNVIIEGISEFVDEVVERISRDLGRLHSHQLYYCQGRYQYIFISRLSNSLKRKWFRVIAAATAMIESLSSSLKVSACCTVLVCSVVLALGNLCSFSSC